MRIFITLALFVTTGLYASAQIVINEVVSNNQSSLTDQDGEYSDWIELFNAGTSSVNINGYRISDNPDSLNKWTFPSTTIGSGQFLKVFCSGKNKFGNQLHTNFTIASTGETIYLSDAGGSVIDNLSIGNLPPDQSYGHYPDAGSFIGYLSFPTPAATNNIASQVSGALTEAPQFSIRGGLYSSAQTIALSHSDPGVMIRYTLDGKEPNENSALYTAPFQADSRAGDANEYSLIRTSFRIYNWLFDWQPPAGEVFKSTPVRARAFKNNYLPSPISTETYFVDPDMQNRYGDMPVVSIVSDPKHLFNDTTGIYVPGIHFRPLPAYEANYFEVWHRPANIEMYMPDGSVAFNSNFKISINGQSSPSSPQKGINVNSDVDYGISKIEYPLFSNYNGPAKYIREFDKIKFRAWGSDRAKALFRDAFCASYFGNTGLDVEAYRPVIVFIDGEYWGIHEMRERAKEESYYREHYNQTNIDLIEDDIYPVVTGDTVHWSALTNFINNNSLSVQSNYEYVKTQMDVDNFMLNYMASIYFSRGDWPYQNEAKWRPKTPDGKWKWILWDMDNTTGHYLNPWYNMFQQVLVGSRGYGPSPMLISLVENQEFKNNFVNLFADWMNTSFLPPLATARVDQMKDELAPYMNEMKDRWQANYNWTVHTDSMKWFLNLRPQFCKQQILSTFSINNLIDLTIDVSDTAKGMVKVNTIRLDNETPRVNPNTYPWTGQYFSQIPVPLTAIAKPGYRFLHWLPGNDTSQSIIVSRPNSGTYTAVFDIDPNYVPFNSLVINEVMSSNLTVIADEFGEYDDWIEIYNPNNDTIDLAGYSLTDNFANPFRYTIATGNDSTKISPGGHLLIWADDDRSQGILHTNFKFNATGDQLALIDRSGEIVDTVTFGIVATDISYGRKYDGSAEWKEFTVPTPRAANWTWTADRIVINEFQTDNSSTIADEYGDHDQWIELYNPNGDTIDIAGWFLTNNSSADLYRIGFDTDTTKIPPYGFLLAWTDNEIAEGVMHTNFNLNPAGGRLALNKPDKAISDTITYRSAIPSDQSYGRSADGVDNWVLFTQPTPDSSNNNVGIGSASVMEHIRIWPNPATGGIIHLSKAMNFTLVNAIGQEIRYYESSRQFDVSDLNSGIYFLKDASNGMNIKLMIR